MNHLAAAFLLLVLCASSVKAQNNLRSTPPWGGHLRALQLESDPESNAASCGAYPDDIKLSLSRADVQLAFNAQELNMMVTRARSGPVRKVVREQKDNPYYERFTGYSDINDQAIIAKVAAEATCYASFMGDELWNPFDQLQNINCYDTEIENTDCKVRSGYLDAYNTTYQMAFREEIDNCVASCGSSKCPLVLTGYSQGGAAAIVAAIDLDKYNPTTITFGAPRAIIVNTDNPCTTFNAARHFRYIATADGYFDNVPFETTSDADSLGWPLMLDGMDFPIYSPGFNNDDNQDPQNAKLHGMGVYMDYVTKMFERNCFPVPVGLWPTGHACHDNSECQGQYCKDNVCDQLIVPGP